MASASTTLRRLMKEAQELSASSSSPSPHFHAHPTSDSDLFDWHFTLAGPPAPSPFANGIYHGRIVLPAQYPLRPPSFRFLTPTGRFEVNREICLSISGHHDESWQPAWGIRTALTAIRSFMDGEAKGQVGGLDTTDEVRKEWAEKSREWVCPTCSNGRNNASILKEWWDVCREKGVNVGGDEDRAVDRKETDEDDIPAGLKLSYRDELGAASSSPAPNEASPAQPRSGEEQSRVSSSVNVPQSSGPSTPAAATDSSNNAIPRTANTAGNVDLSQSPTPTSPPSQRNEQGNHAPLQSTPSSRDGPWLDRAIVCVLIALVAMILKKIINARSTM